MRTSTAGRRQRGSPWRPSSSWSFSPRRGHGSSRRLRPPAPPRRAGTLLALGSTLGGNLLIGGSIANIIGVDAAERGGLRIDGRRHARGGVPVTIATLATAGASLWLRLAST